MKSPKHCCAVVAAVVAAIYGAGLLALNSAPPERRFAPLTDAVMRAPAPPVAIVTGANVGIGYEAALEMVARGYTTVVASRSVERGQAAVAAMTAELERLGRLPANGARPVFIKLDLADFNSVVDFALEVRARFQLVHALVLNAGMNVAVGETLEQRTTRDGFEICMQVRRFSCIAAYRLFSSHLLEPRRQPARLLSHLLTPAGQLPGPRPADGPAAARAHAHSRLQRHPRRASSPRAACIAGAPIGCEGRRG